MPAVTATARKAEAPAMHWMIPMLVLMIGSFMAVLDSSIVNAAQYGRLKSYLDQAHAAGARIVELAAGDAGKRILPPTLVLDAREDLALMQDEIFGPILPLVAIDSVDAAIDYINARPRPLALYHFDTNAARTERVLERTIAGGVSVNDTRPEAKIATTMVTANSRNMRPTCPDMNTSGMKTAASDTVIERMVKLISRAEVNVASKSRSPRSIRRTVFSRKTIASSTRKPMARVRAISERLSRL